MLLNILQLRIIQPRMCIVLRLRNSVLDSCKIYECRRNQTRVFYQVQKGSAEKTSLSLCWSAWPRIIPMFLKSVDIHMKGSPWYPGLNPQLTTEYKNESVHWHPNTRSDLVRWRVMGWRGTKILRTTSIFRDETKVDIAALGFSAHPMKSMEV